MKRPGPAVLAQSLVAVLGMTAAVACQPTRTVYAPRTAPRPAAAAAAAPAPRPPVAMKELPTTMSAEAAEPASAEAARGPLINGGQPATGRPCRVHLRRDAMGLTGMSPLPLNAGSPGARALQFDGTLEDASDRWVVLRSGGKVYWFPADVILTIEFTEAR